MKTILVVDDDGWLREFISEFLRWRSYNVIEAKDERVTTELNTLKPLV